MRLKALNSSYCYIKDWRGCKSYQLLSPATDFNLIWLQELENTSQDINLHASMCVCASAVPGSLEPINILHVE